MKDTEGKARARCRGFGFFFSQRETIPRDGLSLAENERLTIRSLKSPQPLSLSLAGRTDTGGTFTFTCGIREVHL